ncbi:AHH domain-containing protein [Sphingopyxis indica]|uniref:AHH domain-containing protein n=1 Tax=Sphingopyxis indica TaxID=436663 RepID=UPI002938E2F2|nr:AHH domain-containing protein [Sphingopyxis indica]WOF44767.1 AHH domain-containing protein [Sphingopyxis indica]
MRLAAAASVHRRRWQGAVPVCGGFQRHHLILVALLRRTQMAAMFDALRSEGFALQRFDLNGLVLPASERTALESGHALHRGPHHGYSDAVAARVERVRAHFAAQAPGDPRTARRVAIMRLRLLQDATRRALTDRHRLGFWLNRRDPMRLFADRPYLDEAIDKLFGA